MITLKGFIDLQDSDRPPPIYRMSSEQTEIVCKCRWTYEGSNYHEDWANDVGVERRAWITCEVPGSEHLVDAGTVPTMEIEATNTPICRIRFRHNAAHAVIQRSRDPPSPLQPKCAGLPTNLPKPPPNKDAKPTRIGKHSIRQMKSGACFIGKNSPRCVFLAQVTL